MARLIELLGLSQQAVLSKGRRVASKSCCSLTPKSVHLLESGGARTAFCPSILHKPKHPKLAPLVLKVYSNAV